MQGLSGYQREAAIKALELCDPETGRYYEVTKIGEDLIITHYLVRGETRIDFEPISISAECTEKSDSSLQKLIEIRASRNLERTTLLR